MLNVCPRLFWPPPPFGVLCNVHGQPSLTIHTPSLRGWSFTPLINKGRPNHDHDHFWVHLAGPHFSFLRYPDDAPNAPSTQRNTEKPQRFFIWCVIKRRFGVAMQNSFLENYGCGCVWAVPELRGRGSKKHFKTSGFGQSAPLIKGAQTSTPLIKGGGGLSGFSARRGAKSSHKPNLQTCSVPPRHQTRQQASLIACSAGTT